MNPSSMNYQTWMIFMNNCELIFRMYQIRQRKQKAAQEKIYQLEEISSSDSEADDEYKDYAADKSISASSHVNNSYVEDSAIMPPTIELHAAIEQKVQLVDSAMQTSGEWKNILCNIQSPLVARQQELLALPSSAADVTDQSEEIEMSVLNSSEYEDTQSYCNKGYECDTTDTTLTHCPRETREHSHPPTPNILAAGSNDSETESAKLNNKTVKFSGCQIINDRNDHSLLLHTDQSPDTNVLSVKRKLQADQLGSVEAKWHRLREMELEQWGEVLSYKGRCDSEVRDVAFAQARFSLNPANFYFKVKVLETGNDNYIAIGLTSKHYPSYEMPGWKRKSVGYHADDGKLYIGKETGLDFGPKLKEGDELCCGLLFGQEWTTTHSRNRSNYFTYKSAFISAFDNCTVRGSSRSDRLTVTKMFVMLNGEMIGIKMIGLVYDEYYPTIGLLSEGAKVKVDLLPTIAAAC